MERLEYCLLWGREMHGRAGNVHDKTTCSAMKLHQLLLWGKKGILTQEELKQTPKNDLFL